MIERFSMSWLEITRIVDVARLYPIFLREPRHIVTVPITNIGNTVMRHSRFDLGSRFPVSMTLFSMISDVAGEDRERYRCCRV